MLLTRDGPIYLLADTNADTDISVSALVSVFNQYWPYENIVIGIVYRLNVSKTALSNFEKSWKMTRSIVDEYV